MILLHAQGQLKVLLHVQIAQVHSACLSLVYTFVYPEKTLSRKYAQMKRRKVFSLSIRFHVIFNLSHFLILLKTRKKISHKQLTCSQQNSEDTHRAGSPQKFLEMDFHRSQASTDHRKVLSCCVDKPVRHGKKIFSYLLLMFFQPLRDSCRSLLLHAV